MDSGAVVLPVCSQCYTVSRDAVRASLGVVVPETGGTVGPVDARADGAVGDEPRRLDPETRTDILDYLCQTAVEPWMDPPLAGLTRRTVDAPEAAPRSRELEELLEIAEMPGWKYPVPFLLPPEIGPFDDEDSSESEETEAEAADADAAGGTTPWEPPTGGPRAGYARDPHGPGGLVDDPNRVSRIEMARAKPGSAGFRRPHSRGCSRVSRKADFGGL